MTTEPAKPPESRESADLLQRALSRVRSAKETLREGAKPASSPLTSVLKPQ